MVEFWRENDYRGREVAFTSESQEHILQHHHYMVDRFQDVRNSIERPDVVTQDLDYRHRENHYRRTRQGWLKVVVHYRPALPQGTWIGEVITAYRVRKPHPREEQIGP